MSETLTHYSAIAVDPGASPAEFRYAMERAIDSVWEHTARREITLDLTTFKVEFIPGASGVELDPEDDVDIRRPDRIVASVQGAQR